MSDSPTFIADMGIAGGIVPAPGATVSDNTPLSMAMVGRALMRADDAEALFSGIYTPAPARMVSCVPKVGACPSDLYPVMNGSKAFCCN